MTDTISQRDEVLTLLASGYSRTYRLVEISSIFVATFLMVIFGYYLWLGYQIRFSFPYFLLSVFLGYFTADFLAGIIHWAADTWGTVEFPIFGPTIIRNFREHHIDPLAMTQHDFIETNGSSFLVSIPFILFFITYQMHHVNDLSNGLQKPDFGTFLFVLYIASVFSNQFHKWAHTDSPPYLVSFLQYFHIILPRKHHHIHHISPHACYYTIANGWANYPLEFIRFWTILEFVIFKITGSVPRSDDLRWYNRAYKNKCN